MQVSIESLQGLQRKMTVQVPADKITTAIDRKLKEISKTVRLDGFRPGKVPASVVKQKFGGQVRQEVLSDVIESSYRDAIIQQKIRPAGMPDIQPVDGDDKEGMAYSATFEVYPEIESVELKSIEVEKLTADIADTDLDTMIDKLRQQHKQWVEVDRAAQKGDQVMVDFEGKIDGEIFNGGTGKDMPVEIGAGQMLKEFEEGLLGMSQDEEKTIDVSFPEDYHGKDVAGKTAQFTLRANKVAEGETPELDEDLVKKFGVENGDLETFKANVRSNMEKELAQKLTVSNKNNVMTALLGKNEISAPEALVIEEIKILKMQMMQNMGKDPSTTDSSSFPDDLFRKEAVKRVQLGLLVGELVKLEEIKLDQSRFDTTLKEMASSYEQPQQVLEYYSKNQEARTNLEGMVLEDQVVDHILEIAKVTEKSVSFDEIMDNPVK